MFTKDLYLSFGVCIYMLPLCIYLGVEILVVFILSFVVYFQIVF
jgi:hypothetical protein